MSAERRSHWIFLRGLVRESAHWDDFPDRFVRAIPAARTYLFDLPGNGTHWRLLSPSSIGGMMEFTRREVKAVIREHLEPEDSLYLFTVSLGSMVAIEWASRHPQEIAGAVLVNTSLRRLSSLHRRLAWRCWPLLGRIMLTRDPAERERLILRLTARTGAENPALIAARVQAFRQHPVRPINVLRQLWAAAHYCPPLANPGVRFLLLNSLGDRMVDPACSEVIADRWSLEIKTHPWAGHDLPLDDPDWTGEAVRAWLNREPGHRDRA